MKKILKIEGMMCSYCEKHVKEALKKIEGVQKVKANHKTGTAELILKDDVSDEILQKAVEEAGYKVIA